MGTKLQALVDALAKRGAKVKEIKPNLDTGRLHEVYAPVARSDAEAVTIAEISDEESEVDAGRRADDVVRYLARHNVRVGPTVATHPKGGVAYELIRIAKAEGADLIVAGAYGHSRLGEWVFGGVTRDLLASSPVCCLLAH